MFSSLLVATDGSSHASHAIKVAIDLAKTYHAKLHVVHVLSRDFASSDLEHMIDSEHLDDSYHAAGTPINIGISSSVAEHGMMRSGDREARMIEVIGERIAASAVRKAQEEGLDDITSSVRGGDYANAILEAAKENRADMIVMGRRGLSTLKGFMVGSVSQKVSQRAGCSVLTVK